MKIIDLRSDTVTRPGPQMREAIAQAEVGDDVYGEDPAVNRLEQAAAEIMGKEAALFVPSGTMGNLLALLTHCGRGDEVILGRESHIAVDEQGGISALGGIHPKMIPNQPDGTLQLRDIELAFNDPDDIHFAKSTLICLENTWHGIPLSLSYMQEVRQIANRLNLALHLDGARIFNASLALGTPPAAIAGLFDTLQFCFSKGLGAPIGSALCGSAAFIKRARRLRKMVGGGMRQVGFAAAACIFALENMVDRLDEDHANAKLLADALRNNPDLKVADEYERTNMVFVRLVLPGFSNADLVDQLRSRGVLACEAAPHGIRFVTHYGIDSNDIHEAAAIINDTTAELRKNIRVRANNSVIALNGL